MFVKGYEEQENLVVFQDTESAHDGDEDEEDTESHHPSGDVHAGG